MQTQILGLLAPIMSLFFAATFVVLWRVGRLKRHVLGFGCAYFLFVIGFLITHFLPAGTPYLFHATQAFYSIATVILLASVCERAGQQLHLGSMVTAYAVAASVLGLAVSLSNDVAPRLVIVNMGYGVMFAMGLTTLLMARRRSIIDLAIIAMITIQAVDFLARPTITLLFETSIPAEVYRDSIYYSLIGLVLGLKGASMALVLIGATVAEWTMSLRQTGARDRLTGLLNRGAFEDEMRGMLPRAQLERRPLSLVVADIDHFKQVNDIWGHQAGDHAITAFGTLIQNTIRGCDVAGRIGGEEFCVAVWNCENEPAERLAERIRLAFAHVEHEGLNDDIRLTASLGVASARPGETYRSLFARADAALYEAKANGRNRVENAEHRRAGDARPLPDAQPAELKQAAAGR